MKYKFNKSITMSIIGIVVVVCIVGLGSLIKKGSEVISHYNENKKILNLVQKNKSIENIKKEVPKEKSADGSIPTSEKIAYITIDDGPSKYTNDILDILKENDVKATFFMIDGNMKKHEGEVERIKKEGHGAGFHSVTHDVDELYKSSDAALNEFETCQETFYNITGEVSNLIRIPYGSKPYMPEDSYKLLAQKGYKMWDWNLDTQDWKATTDNIVSNVLYYARDNPNLVILMHEKQQTVDALDSMIRVLKERGYDIRPVTEDIEDRNFWDENL